jgi:hypothetical protein
MTTQPTPPKAPPPGPPRGTVALPAKGSPEAALAVGFEHGCPGAAIHLGLRFYGQPGTAVDGKTFPAAEWEQSPFFVSADYPTSLAGVIDETAKPAPPAPKAKPAKGAPAPAPVAAPPRDAAAWKALLAKSARVTAPYFLVHDTGGGSSVPTTAPGKKAADRGVHLFIGKGNAFLNHDYATPHTATECEYPSRHPEFDGKIIHMEILNSSLSITPNPPDTYADKDYLFAALAYVYASYRAGEWLTVTCHLEVDRGYAGGHCDPRGFSFDKLYNRVGVLVPSVSGKTFGILQARIGDNTNQSNYKNTFPAQYGAVQRETRLTKK